MEAHDHHEHHHHEMPTEGSALTGMAVSATLHCLTGCAIGEVAGMAIGTALGLSNLATIALAIVLAFVFGYSLTSMPLLRAGMALSAVVPVALASDTLSIATMEVVDNLVMVVVPGAMHAGLGDLLFWGSLSFALAAAFVLTVPVNRWLLARGKGHCAVHETGIHGGPSPRVVGTVLAVAAVFGVAVLVAEFVIEENAPAGGHGSMAMPSGSAMDEHGAGHGEERPAPAGGLALQLDDPGLAPGEDGRLTFRVAGHGVEAVTDFDVLHERRMHLIVVRRDLTGFQHLHPEMAKDGTWSVPVSLRDPGSYRAFADFSREGAPETLSAGLEVAGNASYRPLPAPSPNAGIAGRYDVALDAGDPRAGSDAELTFRVARDGSPADVEPYLGADGHLVALREGDLEFIHVHPIQGETDPAGTIRFMSDFPTAGSYRLFLQFKDEGEVRTAEFTLEVPE
jgi:hypothetical protein